LSLLDLTSAELSELILRGIELKALRKEGKSANTLTGKNLAMIFDKSSTRTRVSFEVGMSQLGGHAIFLSPRDTQLGRGEPLPDAARVISRMVDGVMIRTFDHDMVTTFARYSEKPVINGLTDLLHPCQLLADMQTYFEHRGSIAGKQVTWIGDGNNMCHSYINAAIRYDFELNIACPEGYDPDPAILENAGDHAKIIRNPMQAAAGSNLIVTDVWASMGQEEEQKQREKAFSDYQVNSALMEQANKDALFMHCLPAHREEEVTTEVLEGPQSVIWDEAENRLYAQNALLEFLMA
ncbi:MAG TPA: ornithine carbamoyltransferase, partial [Gammaproteobacteria bacterium]|nr:ornithine carbamoyltransferase [Gammaproteobacteria bacterium]